MFPFKLVKVPTLNDVPSAFSPLLTSAPACGAELPVLPPAFNLIETYIGLSAS